MANTTGSHMHTHLSVNVNKIATLRNARGKNSPDVLQTSLDLIRFGAAGITVHPRPDGRHIRREDVFTLKKNISVEFNIEGYPSEDFLQMNVEVKPDQCTLVPDPPDVMTSNAGWKVNENRAVLKSATERLKAKGIRVSVFIDPRQASEAEIRVLKDLHVDRIELYTEEFAEAFSTPHRAEVTEFYRRTAACAQSQGIGVNAGHDLNLENLKYLVTEIPGIAEVSIGHALVCDALYLGFEETMRRYLDCLRV